MNIFKRLNLPILIDGVDVTYCKYREKTVCSCIDVRDCEGNIDILVTDCKEHPNCYYKEWQREQSLRRITDKRICKMSVNEVTSRQCQEIIQLQGKIDRYMKFINSIVEIEKESYKRASEFTISEIHKLLKKNKL